MYVLAVYFPQSEYLSPHLHGIVAYFNAMLVRLDYFENSEKGKQVISSYGLRDH